MVIFVSHLSISASSFFPIEFDFWEIPSSFKWQYAPPVQTFQFSSTNTLELAIYRCCCMVIPQQSEATPCPSKQTLTLEQRLLPSILRQYFMDQDPQQF
jgi:hypothetical protein